MPWPNYVSECQNQKTELSRYQTLSRTRQSLVRKIPRAIALLVARLASVLLWSLGRSEVGADAGAEDGFGELFDERQGAGETTILLSFASAGEQRPGCSMGHVAGAWAQINPLRKFTLPN